MTAEQNQNNLPAVVPEVVPATPLETKARAVLTQREYDEMRKYVDAGGKNLSVSKATEFFELFMNGTTTEDIFHLNGKLYPHGAIILARIKDGWDERKTEYVKELQDGVISKMLRAKLDTINLMGDVIAAASKKHGKRLKLYLQTGDEKYLEETMSANNIANLQKAIETISKATGEDRKLNVNKTESLNVNVNAGGNSDDSLSIEAAAQIVSIVAAEKRKKNA